LSGLFISVSFPAYSAPCVFFSSPQSVLWNLAVRRLISLLTHSPARVIVWFECVACNPLLIRSGKRELLFFRPPLFCALVHGLAHRIPLGCRLPDANSMRPHLPHMFIDVGSPFYLLDRGSFFWSACPILHGTLCQCL